MVRKKRKIAENKQFFDSTKSNSRIYNILTGYQGLLANRISFVVTPCKTVFFFFLFFNKKPGKVDKIAGLSNK